MRPRNKIIKLCAYVLLTYAGGGAIVNVAVAWGCARHATPSSFGSQREIQDYVDSLIIRESEEHPQINLVRFGWKEPDLYPELFRVATIDRITFGATMTTMYAGTLRHKDMIMRRITCGSPFRGLYGECWVDYRSSGRVSTVGPFPEINVYSYQYIDAFSCRHVVVLGGGTQPYTDIVPLRPRWPGFAINTMFYAATLWLLCVGPGFVRRRLRARRGQCPACAYPIGTMDVCTECGKQV